ncbi:trypsin-like serine protease [Tenacibaculum finnmarkense]|nr:trypsin-like serine protease [Tenacibaculum finnmarkense]
MSKELLKQLVVRITTSDGTNSITSSGVIVKNRNEEYSIITAEHCIYGKKTKRLKDITDKCITVEYKKNNSDSFKKVKIKKILYSHEINDIAIISISSLNGQADNLVCSGLENESDCTNLCFRGFPKWLNKKEEAKTFNCTIEENDNQSFLIKADELKDDSLMLDVTETSSGLSGSGVFDIKNGKMFLIGIVTDLRDSNASFGHIKCSKLDDIFNKFDFEVYPLSNKAQQLFLKSDDLDKEFVKKRIQELRESKNDRFDNLYRKCKEHLYDKEITDEIVDKILTDFFSVEISLKALGKLNSYIQEDFDNAMYQLSKRVEINFNKRPVNDISEAQDIYAKVKDFFIEVFKEENENRIKASIVREFSENVESWIIT